MGQIPIVGRFGHSLAGVKADNAYPQPEMSSDSERKVFEGQKTCPSCYAKFNNSDVAEPQDAGKLSGGKDAVSIGGSRPNIKLSAQQSRADRESAPNTAKSGDLREVPYQAHRSLIIEGSGDDVNKNGESSLPVHHVRNGELLRRDSSNSVLLDAFGHGLNIRVLRTPEELKQLRPAWERLLSDCPQASIFSTWEWLAAWWRAFGAGQQLHVLAFEDFSSQLVGLAPLSISKIARLGKNWRVLRLMGDGSGDSDNLDLPVRAGFEDAFALALVDYLDKRFACWDICEFNTMPSYSPTGNRLHAILHQRGWSHLNNNRPWSVVQLPSTWESYLKRLSAKERGKLGSRSRRLQKRYSVRIHNCSEASEISSSLSALFQLHQEHWSLKGQRGSFVSIARQNFYHEISRLFHARKWLELWVLDLDGKPVAAQFGFRYRDTFFCLQEGFDPDHASDSVGYVLRGHVIGELIAAGVRRYDFLGGEGPEKTRWGAQVGNYVDIHFAKPYTRGSLYLKFVVEIANVKEWLRPRSPKAMWSILQWLNLRLRGVVKGNGMYE
jgi:CelD/BcsL family acetyltransferase involved in cellulose biosynthesis